MEPILSLTLVGNSSMALKLSKGMAIRLNGVLNSWEIFVKNCVLDSLNSCSLSRAVRSIANWLFIRARSNRILKAIKITGLAKRMYKRMAHHVFHHICFMVICKRSDVVFHVPSEFDAFTTNT